MLRYGNTQSYNCIGPECKLTIINPADPSRNISLKAIVDSGSTRTAIPQEQIEEWDNCVFGEEVIMRTADGRSVEVKTYRVILQIADIADKELTVEAVAIPGKPYALIGRDILNKYKVVLDAVKKPESEWRLNCNKCCDHTLMTESKK